MSENAVPRLNSRLAYRDVDAAIAWMTEVVGFRERVEARISSDFGELAWVDLGDDMIIVGTADAHGLQTPKELGGCTQQLMVYVDDVDALVVRAEAAGSTIVAPPADQFFGDRRAELLDPEGHAWAFHQHLRDVPREEWPAELRGDASE